MRTKKAFRIVLANVIAQVTVTLCGLIIQRYVLHTYGSEINGLTSSIRQILTYMTVVGSGISLTAMTALYKPIAENDTGKINGVLSATRIFFNKSGLIFTAASAALVVVYPLIVLGQVDPLSAGALVLINATGTMIEFFVANKYRAFLTANQQFNVISNITTQGMLLNTIVSVVLIKLGMSIIVVQAASMAIYVVRMIMIAGYTKKRYPYLDFHATPDHGALSQRWSAFSYQVSGMVISYSPVLILTIFSGLKEVSVFWTYNMVYVAINMLILTFASGIPAGFGEIIVQGDEKKLHESFNSFETAYYMMSFGCYTCFALLIQPFAQIYAAGVNDVNYVRAALAIAFVTAGIARTLRSPHVTLVEAAGHFKQNRTLNIVEAGLNLALSVAFVLLWGVTGVVIAMAVSALLRSVLYIIYGSNTILKRGLLPTLKKIASNLVAGALSMLPFLLVFHIEARGFLEWFKWAAIAGVWTMLVFVGVNFATDFRAMRDLLGRLTGLLRRRQTNDTN